MAERPKIVRRTSMRRVLEELIRNAERQAAERDRKRGPLDAEVGTEPARWHVVITEPNRENTAAAALSARRFGVYVPELSRRVAVGGKHVIRTERMFPGYVLVWVWDVERHRRRIEACVGVSRILRLPSGEAVELADRHILYLQAQEAQSHLSALPKGRTRHRRNEPQNLEIPEGAIRVSCRSYWGHVGALDSGTRNELFRRALGLQAPASSTAP